MMNIEDKTPKSNQKS
jgi:L-lactate utilization protein LutC